jgi:uncharacterized protein YbjT (DUF2867 family)
VPFTIVGPTGFADGDGGATGIFLGSRKDFQVATITRADVAAVAVEALNNPDAFGKSVYIQNDESIEPGAWRGEFANVEPEE